MSSIPQNDSNAEMRERILSAASHRFVQYGYNKTTMAEIAQDCGMSAANLYRYFENKHDIGAGLACRCLADRLVSLRGVVNRADITASEQIEMFVLENLREVHRQWSAQPRMHELVDDVTRQRIDIVGQHIKSKRALLIQVIEAGKRSGEFGVRNPARAADAILSATFLFDYPNLMGLFPLEVFETKARDVCRLLIDGLRGS